jgi:threonine dehydrogenase-like Zn-dependent dehydrogenase
MDGHMKATCWYGVHDVRVETVPDPSIINPHDAIIKVNATSICGSDLHLYDGYIPTMQQGDIIGHEFMGEVVEVGKEVRNLQRGDRVVVPSIISCGHCYYCRNNLWSLCDNTNPNAGIAEAAYGFAPAGIYGYSHAYGGYAGSQAEYVRVPFADVDHIKVPDNVTNEQAVFISDAFPTGFMGADNCEIRPGQTVAVWGCGAVGLFAMRSAYMLGAERVIAIDRYPERLRMASEFGQAITLNYEGIDVVEELKQLTGGEGPDACIDAVGLESHGATLLGVYDKVKQAAHLVTDRIDALREAIQACRKGGTVSIMGVYGGYVDKFPLGAAFSKGLTLRLGQMHAHRYLRPIMERVEQGEIDPSAIITHRMSLQEAPQAFEIFKHKNEDCVRVLITP